MAQVAAAVFCRLPLSFAVAVVFALAVVFAVVCLRRHSERNEEPPHLPLPLPLPLSLLLPLPLPVLEPNPLQKLVVILSAAKNPRICICICLFSLKNPANSHVKPQNRKTPYHPTTYRWHLS